jgi:hypothetical protein
MTGGEAQFWVDDETTLLRPALAARTDADGGFALAIDRGETVVMAVESDHARGGLAVIPGNGSVRPIQIVEPLAQVRGRFTCELPIATVQPEATRAMS